MKLEHLNEIKGIVILALSLILLASLVSFSPIDLDWFSSKPNLHVQNWIGIAGAYTAGIFFFLVGFSAYFLVGLGVFFSWNKFTSRDLPFNFFRILDSSSVSFSFIGMHSPYLLTSLIRIIKVVILTWPERT